MHACEGLEPVEGWTGSRGTKGAGKKRKGTNESKNGANCTEEKKQKQKYNCQVVVVVVVVRERLYEHLIVSNKNSVEMSPK